MMKLETRGQLSEFQALESPWLIRSTFRFDVRLLSKYFVGILLIRWNDCPVEGLMFATSSQDLPMLGHAPILVAEDDPLLALEIQVAVEDASGEVVGPVGSSDLALEFLKSVVIAGAILEVPLADGDVTRVAEALVARRIPMVFQSELDLPPDLQQLCPDVPFYKRPAPPRLLVEKLAQLIRPEDWA